MDRLQGEAEQHPMRRSQLTAIRFYLRDLLTICTEQWLQQCSHITNYFGLLDQLQAWRERTTQPVCIVTFNYDLMLEDALPTIGVDTSTLKGYLANPDWQVIKPHGSVNWARLVDTPIQPPAADTLVSMAAQGIRVSQEYVITTGFTSAGGNRFPFPAIAIPMQSCKDFECPPKHLDRLEQCLRDTHEILIIGWQATERNFLEMMANAIPSDMRYNVVIVCGDEQRARATHSNLVQAGVGRNANVHPYSGGFTELVTRQDVSRHLL